MSTEIISSTANPKIKALKKLEKTSERKAQNKILIEGLRETVLAARAGFPIQTLYVCADYLKTDGEYRFEELKFVPSVIPISKQVYEWLAYREGTEGVIAIAEPKHLSLTELQLPANCLVLVIEAVEKPGNLGAMLRTADAAGADAVIICDAKTDVYNPNVIRSSVGTVFTNRVVVADTQEVIRFLKNKHIGTFAAELHATSPHFAPDYTKPTAFVVGTEATGLSDVWLQAANQKIKIPMKGMIDSLNVSVSAAVLLYEAVRQRNFSA